jgi:hypothetical protein
MTGALHFIKPAGLDGQAIRMLPDAPQDTSTGEYGGRRDENRGVALLSID